MHYRGTPIERVDVFKYLELVLQGVTNLSSMCDVRLKAAKHAWAKLMGIMIQHGWHDRATRIMLFEVYVKSFLMYGAAVWGRELLPHNGSISSNATGKFGIFHRSCLRSILGVKGHLQNEIVYILTGQYPL